MTALIADDSKVMRIMLKGILTNCGFLTIHEATDGDIAVELYTKTKPDIVTLDITMGKCDGIEALKQIIKADPGAKVLMISSTGQDIVVRDAIKSGASGFIVKPFTPDQVSAAIKKMLSTN